VYELYQVRDEMTITARRIGTIQCWTDQWVQGRLSMGVWLWRQRGLFPAGGDQ